MIMLMGMGGALYKLTAALDGEHDPYYWWSRIGFGMLPMLRWNESAGKVQIAAAHTGPFIGDIAAASNFIWHMITNDKTKVAFSEQQLYDNLAALMQAVLKAKPASAKGTYLRKVVLTSTMGPGIRVDANAVTGIGTAV